MRRPASSLPMRSRAARGYRTQAGPSSRCCSPPGGMASGPTGPAFGSLENVRIEFGLTDTYDVLGVLPFGYPTRKVIGNKKRKQIDEEESAESSATPTR